MLCRNFPALVQSFVLGFPPLCANQITSVDFHGAGRQTHTIHGAGLDDIVHLLLFQAFCQVIGTGGLTGSDGALDHNALAGRRGQVLGWAHGFAVATFHAVINDLTDRVGGLDVLEMQLRIVSDDRARIENPLRIAGVLHVHHGLIQIIAILTVHKRGHDASSAVLGLQRALLAQHQLHHVLGELVVTVQGLRASKILRDQEVNIAVLRVPENHRAIIVVLIKQHLQFSTHTAELLHGHSNVLQQRHRALRAVAHDLCVQAVAHHPHLGAPGCLVGHFWGSGEAIKLFKCGLTSGDVLGNALIIHSLVLHQ